MKDCVKKILVGLLCVAIVPCTYAAYPEQPFPVTGPDAHCVLCQQPLGEEAAKPSGSAQKARLVVDLIRGGTQSDA